MAVLKSKGKQGRCLGLQRGKGCPGAWQGAAGGLHAFGTSGSHRLRTGWQGVGPAGHDSLDPWPAGWRFLQKTRGRMGADGSSMFRLLFCQPWKQLHSLVTLAAPVAAVCFWCLALVSPSSSLSFQTQVVASRCY